MLASTAVGATSAAPPLYDSKATAACLKKQPEYVPKVNALDQSAPLQMAVYPVRRTSGGVFWFVVGFFPPWPDAVHISELHLYFFQTVARAQAWYPKEHKVRSRFPSDRPDRVLMLRRNVVLEWGADNYTPGFLRAALSCLRPRA